MTYPGLDTYPGLSLFPAWTIMLPPPGLVPMSVAPRPQVPVSIAPAGTIPPRMIWKPRLDVEMSMPLAASAELSPTMITVADAQIGTSVTFAVDAVGGAVELTADIAMGVEASATAVPSSQVDVVMPTSAWVVQTLAGMSDNFNRADGSPGSNWLQRRITGTTNAVIASNAVQAGVPSTSSGDNATNQTALVFTPAVGVNNFASEATIVSTPASGYFAGVLVRSDAAMDNYVVGLAAGRDDTAGLWTSIAGTLTRRATFATDAFQAGDVMIVEASGTTYTVKRRRSGTVSTIVSWSDSAQVMPSGSSNRHGGLYVLSVRSTFQTNYGPKLDNWAAYAL
ncbi:hypothetical protein [Rhodococcus sp. A5(2022)]|uniref:hypothetical protein n=1 Tax=Rhodococcus sp. A5(2022) TaxID=3003588 RepID=UPI0022A875A2|nr:hypothetical protein [Rhodococcus sp. A5(2022)]MCZ1070840.1 hypothetical protein [Rhodococcus sp. A5(2022)]